MALTIRLLIAAAVVVVGLGASAATAGADVSCTKFASTSGSDGSGDGSFARPYATPQKLVDSLSAGQTGCLRGGTYRFSLTAVRSARVTLAPYDTESATLKGMIKVLPAGAGSTIEGLKLDGVNSSSGCTNTCGGGSPRIYADDVVLRDDEITNEHTGICVMVGSYYSDPAPRNVTIEQNRIHDCGRLPATDHDHGIYLSQSRGAVVRDNWIYDNADRGIQLYPDAQGSTITGNVIYGNGAGQNFSCDSGSCSRNNVVAGNVIANSVRKWNVYSNSQGATPDGSNVLRDNCMHASNSPYSSNGGIDLAPAFFSSSANLIADPQFEAAGSGDFVLMPSSPCLAKYTGTMSLPTGGSAPVNTALPAISGTAEAGQTLSAWTGRWSGSPASDVYRWRRCDSSGSNCAVISGATSKGYRLTSADVGSTIRIVVTATNSYGSASAASAPTAAAAAAVAAATKIKVRGKGGREHGPKAKGVVSLKSARTSRSTGLRGAVEMKLYRRCDGDWRAISRARRARLTPRGRFHKRLRSFRHHRVRAGTYRVQASYPGSRAAKPSTSLSRKFTVRA